MNTTKLGVVASHSDYMPKEALATPVSLGEGNTPLLKLDNLTKHLGIDLAIWCKFEGTNPTGSFKDRGMAVAVSAAKHLGASKVICASTGNTSASAAAYAARAGMACIVLLPSGKVAAGKLAQARAHGARILTVKGSFDDAMNQVNAVDEKLAVVVNSTNQMRIQGQKTIAFEIVNQLGFVPDLHALPVGNAGNITAHWIGYSEIAGFETKACKLCNGNCSFKNGKTESRPTFLGVQASGAAPFLRGAPVDNPETVATAIRIGNPQSWDQAKAVIKESGGEFAEVNDEALLAMQRMLASLEGIFCEPASAAGLAGLVVKAKNKELDGIKTAVCTLTGHGLKDPDIFSDDTKIETIAGNLDSILAS